MTAWDDYVSAAQRLDTVRREAASIVAEQVAAVNAARAGLTGVRQRTALQRTRLLALAAATGVPAPGLAASPEDAAAARDALGDPPTPQAVRVAVQGTEGKLATADQLLSTVERRVPARNLVAYLGFALLSVLLPAVTLQVTTSTLLRVPAIGCAAVLPLIGYCLAWLVADKARRTPVLGGAATAATVTLVYVVLLSAHAL